MVSGAIDLICTATSQGGNIGGWSDVYPIAGASLVRGWLDKLVQKFA
jgi:hypothetical protein